MKKNQISYQEEVYKKVPSSYLIVVAIYSVLRRGEKCTFEKLVEECFNLFPKAFSFARHPEWPDSLKLDRTLRTLRERGLVMGNPNTLFTLTKFGENVAENTEKILRKGLIKKIRAVAEKPTRDAEVNWIRFLKRSEAFQRFLKEKKRFSITDMELRNLLRCTLETPVRIVKQNLAYSINLAREFKEEELLKFLKFCQQNLPKK